MTELFEKVILATMQSAGDRLRAWRESHNLTQVILAEELGVSQGFLAQLEGRNKTPGLKLAAAIEEKTEGSVPAVDWVSPEQGAA